MRALLTSLTTRGRSFMATGAVLSVTALVLGLDALLRAGVLVAALPLLSAFVSRHAGADVEVTRVVAPSRLALGRTAEVVLTLEDRAAVPSGVLALDDQVPWALGPRSGFLLRRSPRARHHVVSYPITGDVRGKHEVGPLTVRTLDPFGLVQSLRVIPGTSAVTVVPVAVPLHPLGPAGAWSGTGEVRPHALAVGGAEDITVREYQRGDDLRRVHWRSTARTGELMVRREEQPWQSRAGVLLDTRAVAHVGRGATSSLEWAVKAAASAVVYLAGEQVTVRLACGGRGDSGSGWHDRSTHTWVQTGPLLDALAGVTPTPEHTLSDDLGAMSGESGLLLAVLGGLSPADMARLRRLPGPTRRTLCLLLDVESWQTGHPGPSPQARERAAALRGCGWIVSVVGPHDDLPSAWDRLGRSQPADTGRPRVPVGRSA